MGSCFSSYSESNSMTSSTSTAKVISIKGDLHEYPIPIRASQVLQTETESPTSLFICNSDKLYFDDYIPALDSAELLLPDQIYFVLPIARLQYPLTTSDMAALAVKASAALLYCSSKESGRLRRKRKKMIRVSPVVDMDDLSGGDGEFRFDGYGRFEKGVGSMGLSRSGSVRKLQRNASIKARIVYKSFKMRLSTIYENEGSVVAAH